MYFKILLISLFWAMWLEFFYKFGATYDPQNFVGACVLYTIYIAVMIAVFRLIAASFWIVFFLTGTIGLLAEWFLIGNAPWINPNAIQIGMFVFHGSYILSGFYFVHHGIEWTHKRVTFLMAFIFTLFGLSGFFIASKPLQFAWFIWVPLLLYFSLTFRILKKYGKVRLERHVKTRSV